MSFVTAAEMRAIEETAFRRGIPAERLMDQAGAGIARHLLREFPAPGHAAAFIGKGNNSGDALVVLRHLRQAGWSVSVRSAFDRESLGELPCRKWDELGAAPREIPPPPRKGPLLLLDGLLGIGASGPLREPLAGLAAEMTALRNEQGACVVAIDLPSGLDADTGEGDAVTADLTLTVGAPKAGLATPNGILRAGRLHLISLSDLPPPQDGDPKLFCPALFPGLLSPRPHDFHKGDAGRVSIVAGSPGMTGAAILCATGALKAGAGLVSLHVAESIHPLIVTAAPPEIMVRASRDPLADALSIKHDALVIGPGLGADAPLTERISGLAAPIVFDADTLNAIAAAGRFDFLKPAHLLTPHPGEFARLAPDLAALSRIEAARTFVSRHPCTLLLKGARTLVAAPGLPARLNPTGHAGMASGGQGDVLAGVAGALLASGIATPDAASLAAWLCGRAAEIALNRGPFASAGDTLRHLGKAFLEWRECQR